MQQGTSQPPLIDRAGPERALSCPEISSAEPGAGSQEAAPGGSPDWSGPGRRPGVTRNQAGQRATAEAEASVACGVAALEPGEFGRR